MSELKVLELYDNSSERKRQDFVKKHKSKLRIDHNFEKNLIDDSWLVIIEENIRYLDNILRNPNRFIVNEEEVVKVELARRITVESIKHLSKNTSFIQDINQETGDVRPSKILNINKEESFNTYENRVIYTLIKNMMMYIDIKKKGLNLGMPTKNDKLLTYEGESNIGGEKVNISLTLNSKLDDKDTVADFERRIKQLEFKIKDLTNSEVYKSIERARVALITPPIKKTNLILKNVNFQHAMTLWNFLQEEMEDKSEITSGNNVIEDDEKLQKLFDETFLLNYFILNSLDNTDDKDEKIKANKEIILNNLIQQLVLTNDDMSIDQVGEMLDKQFQLVKKQTLATEEEIKALFAAAMDEYFKQIEDNAMGDENEESTRK